MTSSEKAKP